MVCDSVAPCYGRLMDNVALIQLQMNRQDRGIKNEEGGPRCMNYAYYITIALQYTIQKNNVVKIGLWLRYGAISSMAIAYVGHKTALRPLSNSHNSLVWDLYVNVLPREAEAV